MFNIHVKRLVNYAAVKFLTKDNNTDKESND